MQRTTTTPAVRSSLFAGLLALAACLGACCCWKEHGKGGIVPLEPPDSRAVWSIEVADAAEAGLLEQELQLQLVRQEGTKLYFYATENLRGRLQELGYEPAEANPFEVFRRVVLVERRGAEESLRGYGVQVINREERHWVVEASLANLRALARAGYRLLPLGAHDPRPRLVLIRVGKDEEVQRVNELHVDIFSVSRPGGATVGGQGLVICGAAFDNQIDRLRQEGFEVELTSDVCPTPYERGKP